MAIWRQFPKAWRLRSNITKAVGYKLPSRSIGRCALKSMAVYAKTHNNLGVAFREQGKIDEAVASYRRALRSGPWIARLPCPSTRPAHGRVRHADGRYRDCNSGMPAFAANTLRSFHAIAVSPTRWKANFS